MKQLTPAKLSVIMFAAVGLLILAYVGKRMFAVEEPPAAPATRNVPMALSDLEPGTVISEGDIGMGPARISDLQPSTFLTSETIVGRVVKEPIPAARPILTNQVYKRGETPPLEVSDGMQAVTISLSDNTAMVNGLVKPGDYVDVLLTPTVLRDDERLGNGMTMTLMDGVKLLAVNRSFRGSGSSGRSGNGNAVTLELTPTQVRVITLAKTAGDLRLVFNPLGPGDTAAFDSKYRDRVTIDEILGLPPKEPPVDPEPPFMTEFFQRGQRGVHKFRNGLRIGDGYQDPGADSPGYAPQTGPQPGSQSPADSPNDLGTPDDSASDVMPPAPTA